MSTPERTYTLKPPSLQVIDPSHPQAEADALAWGVGVIALSETELTYMNGSAGEVTWPLGEDSRVVLQDDAVLILPLSELEARWEWQPEGGL